MATETRPISLDYLQIALLEAIGVAVYTADTAGRITFFNEEAVALWGRRPVIGKDLWCGSWRIHWPDGRPMEHAEGPMAITLREDRPVRGQEILVERPDGSKCFVLPYPSPLHDRSGTLIGAVNVLIDISNAKEAQQALEKSEEAAYRLS